MQEQKKFSDPNAFIGCSNTMDNVNEIIDNYKPKGQRKFLTVFYDMIAKIMPNKTL